MICRSVAMKAKMMCSEADLNWMNRQGQRAAQTVSASVTSVEVR
jgi:hypothetical protein